MRIMALIVIVGSALTILCGCQSETELLQPWIGQHYINLWGYRGRPQEIIKDESGGKILIYREKSDRRGRTIKLPNVRFCNGYFIKETTFAVNLPGMIISENVEIKWIK